MKNLLLLLLISLGLFAQEKHGVYLTWSDPSNPPGTTYTLYRATGLCSGSPVFNKIATALTAKSYDDTTIIPGNYCYVVTATFQGSESAYSNSVLAPIPTFAPIELNITIK